MKKILALLLAACMVFALCACGKTAAPAATEAPAANDGEADAPETVDLGKELVLYSTMTEGDLDALLTGFNEVYPDIVVEVVSGTIGETTARIAAEADAPQGDLVWGGLADSDGVQYAELFEAWVSAESENAIEGYETPNGIYSMDHLSTVCFAVNKELEAELGLDIRSYEDLLDPKLKGQVILANPNTSSSAWNNLCNIMAVYGTDSDAAWDYIAKLMPNLVITDSSSACFKSVDQGEYVVGLTYEDGAVKLIQDGSETLDMRYPTNGTSASAFGCAVIKNAPHMDAAKAMVDYICSVEGSTYIAQYLQTLRMTNKDTVYGESLLPATEDITWVARDVEYLTENKAAVLEHWNDLYEEVAG